MRKEKILVIEDDPSFAELVCIILGEKGYETQNAANLSEAILQLQKTKPDLMIVDYRLTKETAEDLLQNLRQKNLDFPFIVMTGTSDHTVAVQMMKLGAIDYILKNSSCLDLLVPIVERSLKQIYTNNKLREYKQSALKNEEKLRNIYENMKDVYIEIDRNRIITELSPSAKDSFGYSVQEMLGTEISKYLINPEAFEEGVFSFVLTSGKFSQDIQFKTASGEIRQFEVVLTLLGSKITGTFRDVTQRKKLETELLSSVINTEEKERKRFSEELHDELGPLLTSIKHYLEVILKTDGKGSQTKPYKEQLFLLIDQAIGAIRSISENLTPGILNDFGLMEAIQVFCEGIENSTGIKIYLNENKEIVLQSVQEVVIYRILLELINNTVKHSMAKMIKISFLMKKNQLVLLYQDNGVGFNFEEKVCRKNGAGLKNIASRAKMIGANINFAIRSTSGMEFQLNLPITNNKTI